ncbi:MAG TPA: hypothetical protein VM409_04335 [Chloroflexia bacterium]|nr:hypothetical protein [Chloroflexia bacterium]
MTSTDGQPAYSAYVGDAPEHAPSPTSAPADTGAERLRDRWLALSAIVVLGGISGLAYYLGFTRPYLLSEYYRKPLLDLAKINGHTAQAANSWAFTWIVLFACYYLAFRICPGAKHISRAFRWTTLFVICGWAALFNIYQVFMYPVGAADIFDQIFRARLQAHYDLNPFTTFPQAFTGDPFRPYVAWQGEGSPYGPMWELLAGGTSLMAGNSLWNNLILFKLLVMLAYGVNVALTYGILRVSKPEWALRGTLFFAWNPLVVFEVAGNGHNDSIVVTFLLVAVYMFVLARRYAVIPALMAGALTKFVPIILVPAAAAAIFRDRIRFRARGRPDQDGNSERGLLSSFDSVSILAISGVIAAGLAVVLYARFWEGPQTVGALARQSLFTASLPKVLLDTLTFNLGMPDGQAQALVRNLALGVVALVAIVLSIRILLTRNATTLEGRQALVSRTLSSFYEIIFVYMAFGALWFQPWYLMWLIALTAPVARLENAHRTILFCVGGIANYFVWDFLWLWNGANIRYIQVASAITVYTLPLLYTLFVWLKPLWSPREYEAAEIAGGPDIEREDAELDKQNKLVEAQYPL